MDVQTIRQKFIQFFISKGHEHFSASPIVNKDDPTLMFNNAGMNQFKNIFLGQQKASHLRIVNSQPCLRVSGKHNDLEDVGLDTYHHTMFEMLGNWSFGDYFKDNAIKWAWELLTEVYKLPEERLYITVFGGDKASQLEADYEAEDIWKKYVDPSRIIHCDKKDNFWEMGDTGPCGPCSEIHVDIRSQEERNQRPGKELVNQDHPQVIEIWNLVFIQFNRLASGKLEQLPEKHVDTGLGLERLAMVLQQETSNYDTDVFSPLIVAVEHASGKVYGDNEAIDVAIRVIVDHVRAVTFAIADGQLPSNNKAGYVIRRILRRAVRYGYTYLDLQEPFLSHLVAILADQFEAEKPELNEQKAFIQKVIKEEETMFLKTLASGLKRFSQITENLSTKTIDGEKVFELYDTYGFPPDLTALIAKERNLTIDEKGFEVAMNQQKGRSQKDAAVETGDWEILDPEATAEFVGYDLLKANSKIIRYRAITQKGKQRYQVVLDKTPFYAESGGQVGDQGHLLIGTEEVAVLDTQKENDMIVHYVDRLPQDVHKPGTSCVDAKRRQRITCNHSATHLLQTALKKVLGSHVEQRGSLVNEHLLRFDFSHFSKMTPEEIQQVETMVNGKIRNNIPRGEKRSIPIEEAKKMGATALFGEKYGANVRMITFDPEYSVELCGGNHVDNTGEIGFLKIKSESALAAGIRRIEAVTGSGAESWVQEKQDTLSDLLELLKHPKSPVKAVEQLLKEHTALRKMIELQEVEEISRLKFTLATQFKEQQGIHYLVEKIKLPSTDAVKKLAFEFKQQFSSLFLVLAAEVNGKPHLAVMMSEDVLQKFSKNATDIVKELAPIIRGGGGGQPFFATAGGKDLVQLDEVLILASNIFIQELSK